MIRLETTYSTKQGGVWQLNISFFTLEFIKKLEIVKCRNYNQSFVQIICNNMISKDVSSSKIPIYSNLKEFERNLPKTIELLKTPDGDKVYVVGTAHFSLKSQDDVSLAIRNVIPQGVVLELCPLRLHILQLDEKSLLEEASQITFAKIKEILYEHGLSGGIFYLSFLNTSVKITRQLGVAPGGECRRAVTESKNIKNCKILLGDRPINITLNRALSGLSIKQRLQLSYYINFYNDSRETTITQEDIEKYKDRDLKPLKSMENELPSIFKSFVRERDYILAHSLFIAAKFLRNLNDNSKPVRVVGIVGMGHMSGILKYFGQTKNEKIEEFMKVPRRSWFRNGSNGNGMTHIIMNAMKGLKYFKWIKI